MRHVTLAAFELKDFIQEKKGVQMKIASMAVLTLVFAGFGGAAEDSTDKTPQSDQGGSPIGTQVQTDGKIVSIHNCPMVGVAAPHTLVKLQTEQGDTDIVDLGSTAELKSNGIEPKEGQKLWIDGRVGKVNDKFLIVAEQLCESKMITISRPSALTSETVKHAEARSEGVDVKGATTNGAEVRATTTDVSGTRDRNAPKTETVNAGQQVRTVEGTVLRSRKVKIEGETDEHVVAKLQTSNGVAVIDLGSCPALPGNVNINDGQMLAASGFVGQLNGKPIILANSIGNLSTIQRSATLETTPSSTPDAVPGK